MKTHAPRRDCSDSEVNDTVRADPGERIPTPNCDNVTSSIDPRAPSGRSNPQREISHRLFLAVLALCVVAGCATAQPSEERFQHAKQASDFQWTAAASEDLSTPGPKVLHLEHCSPGVSGANPQYWIYIEGSGIPEAVLVTGGTCAGDGNPGTLKFATAHTHSAGYSIGSATAGIQEATIAALVDNVGARNNHFYQGGYVRVGPGQFQLYAPLTILANHQTVDFSGSSVVCNFDADCINVGDKNHYNATSNVTLVNPRGEPTVLHGQHSFITVWGQKTRILNLMTMPGKFINGVSYGTFGSYVTVASDQAFLLDGMDTTAGFGMECTAANCNAVIKAPGPFSGTGGFGSGGDNAALGWIKNANLNLQCMGNGIDWQSGNGLRLSDSVIEGYAQYGLRGGLAKGGYGMISLENVYEEVGNCRNPSGNIGIAGVIVQGGKIAIRDGEPLNAKIPRFAETGSTAYLYYLVPHSATYGYGNALYMGDALTNGAGTIQLVWPDLPMLADMDILKVPAVRDLNKDYLQGPYGTGNYAIATGLTRAAANCNGTICTFKDTQIVPAKYTVPPKITYFPFITYWPGQLVLGPSDNGKSATSNAWAELALNDLNAVGLVQANTSGNTGQSISTLRCLTVSGSPVWVSCLGSGAPATTVFTPPPTLMSNKIANDAGLMKNQKGRLNFLESGSGPVHIITLVDSNPNKTFAAQANRALNDANDAYIGCDSQYCSRDATGLTFGAPVSVSSYIGNAGDGKNWKERLTEKEKIFAVPVVLRNGSTLTLGSGTPLSQMKLYKAKSAAGSRVPGQSCVDVKATVSGLTDSDQITSLRPPQPLGNLSVNGYASSADTLTLHFCNPTTLPVGIPAGEYSFLALH
jgi:hypothetical protein